MHSRPKKDSIVFLKDRNDPQDDYHDVFFELEFNPVFIPVLKFEPLIDQCEKIINILNSLLSEIHSGKKSRKSIIPLIITSQKAAFYFSKYILRSLNDNHRDILFSHSIVYTVGPACYKMLRILGFEMVLGEQCETGIRLARLILEHKESWTEAVSSSNSTDPSCYMLCEPLYICARERLDHLPKALREGNLKIRELYIYESSERVQEAAMKMKELLINPAGKVKWIVFFSPKGIDVLGDLINSCNSNDLKIAAIGPTTQRHYTERYSNGLHAVAAHPTAKSLSEAILRSDQ